jgi:hypothetical protein
VTPDTDTLDSEILPAEKKGCGSAVTVTGGLLMTIVAGAVLTLFKKKKD